MRRITDEAALQKLLEMSGFASHFSFPAEKYAQYFHAAAGDYILREGDAPQYLYYLATGRAKLYLTLPNGRVSLIDFFDAPCFVGEMELINRQQQSRAVQALVPCQCLALPVSACRALLLQDARFLRYLCEYMSTKINRNVISLSQGHAFPLANRLAAFLLLAAPGGLYREKHTEAAEYLGVSYRHLLYVLADFTARGYLEKTAAGYRLRHTAALAALAAEMDARAAP